MLKHKIELFKGESPKVVKEEMRKYILLTANIHRFTTSKPSRKKFQWRILVKNVLHCFMSVCSSKDHSSNFTIFFNPVVMSPRLISNIYNKKD